MTTASRIVIQNATVVDPIDGVLGRRDIVIEKGTIVALLNPGQQFTADTIIDASTMLVIPGLINSHSHSHAGLAKSVGDRWTLEMLQNYGAYTTSNRTIEDKTLSTEITAAEMLLKGCTACYDLTYEFPVPSWAGTAAIAATYLSVGQRALIAPMMADRTVYEAVPGMLDAIPSEHRALIDKVRRGSFQPNIDAMREIIRNWSATSDLVALAISPTVPLQCSDEFLIAIRDLATEFGLRIQTHLDESRVQAVASLKRFGQTNTARLDALGFLNERLSVAHAVWPTHDDVARLADTGVSVAHSAGSNMKLGAGLASVRRMLRSGVNVGIGTDCGVCCDGSNMFESMRIASYISRVQMETPDQWLSAADVFRMATVGSAKALGWGDKLGRVAVGYAADLVCLDMQDIGFIPLNNIIHQLVFSCDASAVDTVLVGGRIVVRGKKLLTIDMPALQRRAQQAADRLWEANSEIREAADCLAPSVASFCNETVRQHVCWPSPYYSVPVCEACDPPGDVH
ncbi:MAG: amidohydrolase family protein [Dongiaceae bacterium]